MPVASKGRGKGREVRRSRSRNTTPSSGLSTSTAIASGYLDNDLSKLFLPSEVDYAEILDQLGGGGTIPESKTLELLTGHLKTLSKLADDRGDLCNAGMRELSLRRKEVLEDQRELDHDEGRVKVKGEVDEDDDSGRAMKGGKLKKRKERVSKDERPLAVGAHELSRLDGGESGTV
jgi:transcriptional adapter 3